MVRRGTLVRGRDGLRVGWRRQLGGHGDRAGGEVALGASGVEGGGVAFGASGGGVALGASGVVLSSGVVGMREPTVSGYVVQHGGF